MKNRMPRMFAGLVGAVVLVAIGTAADAATTTVIASGLNNPRGLAFGPDGTLYVAEAGTGGSGPCITNSEPSFVCFGNTGSITQVRQGRQTRIVTGLPSLAAVSCMVALAYVTRYSGMDIVLGLTVTSTGVLYPFFGLLLSPVVAAAAMALSSVSVIANALRLRTVKTD